MEKEIFFDDLKEKIKHYFEKAGSHSFGHTERVYNIAIRIANSEEADLSIVKTAALLHDIGRNKEENGEIECHAEDGAEIAKEILGGTEFPKDKISSVIECIKKHRYSKGLDAETTEEKIIQDADRLDALGAICIARVFHYNGKKGRPIYDPKIKPKEVYTSDAETAFNHFYEKILKIKPETFKTKEAQKIATSRYGFIEKFVNEFEMEWNGEK